MLSHFSDPDLCGEGKKYKITKEISGFCKLTIDNCEPKDEATYACCLDKQPDKTETILSLSEYQYKFTKILKSARLIEKDTLTLACELNDARGLVKWFKNDVEIVADKRLEIISDGRKRKLVIRDAKVGDSGNFTCTSNSDKTAAEIIVNCEYNLNFSLYIIRIMNKLLFKNGQKTFRELSIARPFVKINPQTYQILCWTKS